MTIDHLSHPGRSPGITTFYNQRGIAVTDQWLIVYGTPYPMAELQRLERARGPMSSPARAALFVGLAELTVVAPVAFVFNKPAAWAIAALTAAAALGGMMFCGRRWPASFQMWAD